MTTRMPLTVLILGLSLLGCRRDDSPAGQERVPAPLTAREHADLTVATGRAVLLEEHLFRMGELASERAASDDVRSLGRRLVTRHAGKAGRLRVQAAAAGLTLPPPGQRPSPPGPGADTTAQPGRFDAGPMPGTMTGGRGTGVGQSGAAPPSLAGAEVPRETPMPRRASMPAYELTTEWQELEADRIRLAALSGAAFDRTFVELSMRAIDHVLGRPAPDAPPAISADLDASYDRFEEDRRELRALGELEERQDVSGSDEERGSTSERRR